ncbi:MAG TPA: hypothetical protein K8V56_14450 [Sporosarcina psychrophila]|uniref:Uncharacterized protein n=1 Tax=Sporosarcina psychrophila TaxID=1476 RepID=A0A921G1I2_SPOPS|nr:hypothetical protein [Sporosarcina psychrophila]
MSQYIRNELEFLLMPLRRFVDVSREVAPSLDGLFEKVYFIIYDELLNPVYKLSEGAYSMPVANTIRRT